MMGLLELLRSVPPASKMIGPLLQIASVVNANLKYIMATFEQWYRNWPKFIPSVLAKFLTNLRENISENDIKDDDDDEWSLSEVKFVVGFFGAWWRKADGDERIGKHICI